MPGGLRGSPAGALPRSGCARSPSPPPSPARGEGAGAASGVGGAIRRAAPAPPHPRPLPQGLLSQGGAPPHTPPRRSTRGLGAALPGGGLCRVGCGVPPQALAPICCLKGGTASTGRSLGARGAEAVFGARGCEAPTFGAHCWWTCGELNPATADEKPSSPHQRQAHTRSAPAAAGALHCNGRPSERAATPPDRPSPSPPPAVRGLRPLPLTPSLSRKGCCLKGGLPPTPPLDDPLGVLRLRCRAGGCAGWAAGFPRRRLPRAPEERACALGGSLSPRELGVRSGGGAARRSGWGRGGAAPTERKSEGGWVGQSRAARSSGVGVWGGAAPRGRGAVGY